MDIGIIGKILICAGLFLVAVLIYNYFQYGTFIPIKESLKKKAGHMEEFLKSEIPVNEDATQDDSSIIEESQTKTPEKDEELTEIIIEDKYTF